MSVHLASAGIARQQVNNTSARAERATAAPVSAVEHLTHSIASEFGGIQHLFGGEYAPVSTAVPVNPNLHAGPNGGVYDPSATGPARLPAHIATSPGMPPTPEPTGTHGILGKLPPMTGSLPRPTTGHSPGGATPAPGPGPTLRAWADRATAAIRNFGTPRA